MADTHAKHHDYHLVNPSPWPVVGATSALLMAIGLIIWMRSMGGGGGLFGIKGPWVFAIGCFGVVTTFMWWRDVIKEGEHGDHTPVVQLHLRYGMILFIASEVMFFVAWFWAYFDASLFPAGVHHLHQHHRRRRSGHARRGDRRHGSRAGRRHRRDDAASASRRRHFHGTFDPWGLPLVNTLILLTSGTTVTWAHHALLENNRKGLVWGLVLTVILGVLSPPARPTSMCTPASTSPATSTARRSSWPPASTARTYHRHAVPDRLPVPRDDGAIHAQAALRLRGRRLVLALRRRRLAVPVHVHLRVGRRRHAGGAGH